jgi:hypothetical protein
MVRVESIGQSKRDQSNTNIGRVKTVLVRMSLLSELIALSFRRVRKKIREDDENPRRPSGQSFLRPASVRSRTVLNTPCAVATT